MTWKDGVTLRALRSRIAVQRAVAGGDAAIEAMPIVVSCPVL